MGGGEVLKKGSLIKSPPMDSGALKMWRKRWFVLLSSKVLEYYKSDGGEQKGVINLEDCHSINANLSHKRYKHVFNIETKDRVFFLVAKTEAEMDAWVKALCRVCGLHNDNSSLVGTLPPSSTNTKSKGPHITQPIYATTTRGGPFTEQSTRVNPLESVYSLAVNADYEMRHKVKRRELADVPTPSQPSTASGGSGEDVAEKRLSETAFFSPRSGDTFGLLGEAETDTHTGMGRGSSPGHHPVTKARSATLAPSLFTEDTSGLEQRSQTNAAAYSTAHQPQRAQLLPNGYMAPSTDLSSPPSSVNTAYRSNQLQMVPSDDPLSTLDHECAALEEGYGVLHMPPPIDRSNKPQQTPVDTPHPPPIDRTLNPARQKRATALSDSSEGSPQERHWSMHESLPYTKLNEADSPTEETVRQESETQFEITEIPRVTVRSTHYTQVDFNPDTRRPVPLPRKTSQLSGGGTPTSLVPKPRRVNYSDVDIQATSQLSEYLHRQMTVREAEKRALAEKHYINIDRSGAVDDETNPDYYTHMRDLNFDDADNPNYFTVKTHGLAEEEKDFYTAEQEICNDTI